RPDTSRRGEKPDSQRGETHQHHAQNEDVLSAVLVAPMPEDDRTEWPRNVADAKRGQRDDNTHLRVALREEEGRKHQRRGLGVDEEVVVLEGTAYPATRGC